MEEPTRKKKTTEYGVLAGCFSQWTVLLANNQIRDVDLVGAALLAMMSVRKRNSWIGGILPSPIVSEYEEMISQSCKVNDIPGLYELIGPYVSKKCAVAGIEQLSIFQIFNRVKLANIKHNNDDYINHSMVKWYFGERPYVLLHHIPYPMEVLRMQAIGTRVLTLFLKEEELNSMHMARLYYMESNEMHEKDAFDFLIHDMKHMEHFIETSKYLEQVKQNLFVLCL